MANGKEDLVAVLAIVGVLGFFGLVAFLSYLAFKTPKPTTGSMVIAEPTERGGWLIIEKPVGNPGGGRQVTYVADVATPRKEGGVEVRYV